MTKKAAALADTRKKAHGADKMRQNYEIYTNTVLVGRGESGKVYATQNRHNKNLKVAIKVLEKRKLKDVTGRENVEKVLDEVNILH